MLLIASQWVFFLHAVVKGQVFAALPPRGVLLPLFAYINERRVSEKRVNISIMTTCIPVLERFQKQTSTK